MGQVLWFSGFGVDVSKGFGVQGRAYVKQTPVLFYETDVVGLTI